jgi:hypothetical protein
MRKHDTPHTPTRRVPASAPPPTPDPPPRAAPDDRPLNAWVFGAVLALFLVLTGFAWALPGLPLLASPLQSGVRLVSYRLARASATLPFSLSETLGALALLAAALLAVRAIRAVLQGRRRLRNVLLRGLMLVATVAAGWAALTYLTWGYGLPLEPLHERLGWESVDLSGPPESDAVVDELAALCAEYVHAANAAYALVHGTQDLGRPSPPPDWRNLDRALDRGFRRAAPLARLPDEAVPPRGPAKPVLASPVLSRLLVLGYFDPLTAEANYNRCLPGPLLAHTIAHEKAHQRGTLREDEASFLGFLACIHSGDPYARYSGYLYAQGVLLRRLYQWNWVRARAVAARRFPGVARDVRAHAEFLESNAGWISAVSAVAWDLGIRLTGDDDGLDAYERSAELLFAHARHRKPDPQPPGPHHHSPVTNH